LISIDLKGDLHIQGKLAKLVNKQLPFALSKGLNELTVKVRDNELLREYQSTFTMNNKQFFKLTHSISVSSKNQWKQYGAVMSSIQQSENTPPRGSKRKSGERKKVDTSFMVTHVTGGSRFPKKKKKFVPFSTAPIKRNAGGSVRKAYTPTTLYPKNNPRTFISEVRGRPVLFRKMGRAKKVQAMYHLQPFVTNTRKYNPIAAIRSGINKRSRKAFTDAIIFALRTSKLR